MEIISLSGNVSWKDVSVLITGCGSIGKRHARVLRSIGVKDIRICDPAEGQRKSLMAEGPITKEFATYEDGLASQPDAVLICTPPSMHIPMATQAMENGSHVLSEKPFSDSLDGVDELSDVIERSGKVFMVAFCFRYHEGIKKAKAYLDEDRIGRLISIRCRVSELGSAATLSGFSGPVGVTRLQGPRSADFATPATVRPTDRARPVR